MELQPTSFRAPAASLLDECPSHFLITLMQNGTKYKATYIIFIYPHNINLSYFITLFQLLILVTLLSPTPITHSFITLSTPPLASSQPTQLTNESQPSFIPHPSLLFSVYPKFTAHDTPLIEKFDYYLSKLLTLLYNITLQDYTLIVLKKQYDQITLSVR